jgi:hypothetical protein
VTDLAGNQNSGDSTLTWQYDNEWPEFIIDYSEAIVEECNTWTMSIENVTQKWCASGHLIPYSWDGWDSWTWVSQYSLYSGQSWSQIVTIQVQDEFWNYTEKTGEFVWTDIVITAHNFTWSDNVWNSAKTTDWRINSEVRDGACGNWEENVIWNGFVSTWEKWECTVNWDIITYIPNLNETWDDTCEIELMDDEWNTINIEIYWWWIKTTKPECSIIYNDVCTNEWISISMITTWATKYSWTWFTDMSGINTTLVVTTNWTYKWYVKDSAWNTWECEVEVSNYDDTTPIVTWAIETWAECTILEWSIEVSDEWCGSGDLVYNWEWFGNWEWVNYSWYRWTAWTWEW